jgi:hypothetical protein
VEEDEEEGESDDDEEKQPSLEKLRALARVFVPKKVEEYYATVGKVLHMRCVLHFLLCDMSQTQAQPGEAAGAGARVCA